MRPKAATDATGGLTAAITAARRHPILLVNDLIGEFDRVFDNWSEAKDAIANNDAIGGENLFSCGCVMIFRGPTKWESWILQVIPRTKYMRPTNGRNSPPPEVAAADFTTSPSSSH